MCIRASFASNRECGRDSVTVYVLEYDSMPVRKAVSDVGELREMCIRDRIEGSAIDGRADDIIIVGVPVHVASLDRPEMCIRDRGLTLRLSVFYKQSFS